MTENTLKKIWNQVKDENFLVMRNYENMLDDINNSGDIDILCESKERFAGQLSANPVQQRVNSYNYYIDIDGCKIPMDIREIGDGYYDKKWEEDMLKHKESFQDYYIMTREDYVYSLLYHALIHKQSIADKYKEIFLEIFKTCNTEELLKKLKRYMKERGYEPVYPLDAGVAFNENNFIFLQED